MVLRRGIIGTKEGVLRPYGGGAVRNEKTSCKGVCSLVVMVCSDEFCETGLLRDLVRFLIAYPLNTVYSVPVKRGRLYRTESDYKQMRRGLRGDSDNSLFFRYPLLPIGTLDPA